jgi:hypothetical protein
LVMGIPGGGLLVRIEYKWILDVSDLRHSESLPSPMILRIGPSMRRPVSVKLVFLFSPGEFFAFEPSRLCRHPSIRTLLLSDFRSVQVGCSRFSGAAT